MAGRGGASSSSASTEERVKAAVDVFKEKLIRRDISHEGLRRRRTAGRPARPTRSAARIKQGIDSENAKKITKLIRDEGPKGVKAQIQGDEIRVSSKKRDDLQAVHRAAARADLEVALQFVNYR